MNDAGFHVAVALTFIVACAVACMVTARRRGAIHRMRRYGARHGLPVLAPSDEAAVVCARRRAALALIPVSVLAPAVSAVLLIMVQAPFTLASTLLFLIPLLTTCSIVGAIAGSRRRVFTPQAGVGRIARARAQSAADLVGTALVHTSDGIAVLGAGSIVICTAVALLDGTLAVAGILAASLVAACAILIVLRRAERSVLNRPQPADNLAQLAWDDDARITLIVDLRISIAQLGAVALCVPVALILGSQPAPASPGAVRAVLAVAFTITIVVQAAFMIAAYRRRPAAGLVAAA